MMRVSTPYLMSHTIDDDSILVHKLHMIESALTRSRAVSGAAASGVRHSRCIRLTFYQRIPPPTSSNVLEHLNIASQRRHLYFIQRASEGNMHDRLLEPNTVHRLYYPTAIHPRANTAELYYKYLFLVCRSQTTTGDGSPDHIHQWRAGVL